MTPSSSYALERLAHLARLFDHAREHACRDSLALSEILDQAVMVLDEIAPSVAAAKGGPDEEAVVGAALAAQSCHEELVRAIGIEIDRISRELSRLARSTQATMQYVPRRETTLRLLDRSA